MRKFLILSGFLRKIKAIDVKRIKKGNLSLACIFLIVIFLPLSYSYIPLVKTPSLTENRKLAPKPKFTGSINKFREDFERYYNDNFGYRNLLININEQLEFRIFKSSPVKTVVKGKDKWLFFQSENIQQGPGIDDFMGLKPCSDGCLDELRVYFQNLENWFKFKKIHLYLFIGPNKTVLYPEFLPKRIYKYKNLTRMDQILLHLEPEFRQFEYVHLIYPTKSLQLAKLNNLVYQKTDTHWSKMGAFIAYNDLLQEISNDFNYIQPLSLTDFNVSPYKRPQGGDLAAMIGVQNGWDDYDYTFTLKNNNILKNRKIPYVLCYHDSFMEAIKQFVPYKMEKVVYKYHNVERVNSMLKEIEKEKPDIVIIEMVERYFNLTFH